MTLYDRTSKIDKGKVCVALIKSILYTLDSSDLGLAFDAS